MLMSAARALGAGELVRASGCVVVDVAVDAQAVARARDMVTWTLIDLDVVAPDAVESATLMASELLTNALVHPWRFERAGEPLPRRIELWLYRHGTDPDTVVVCAVVDPADGPSEDVVSGAAPDATSGRGLQIVAELANQLGSPHGSRPTRFREYPAAATAAWFSVPAPGLHCPCSAERRLDPAEEIWRVGEDLGRRGIPRERLTITGPKARLRIQPPGISLICEPGTFRYWQPGDRIDPRHCPVSDGTVLIEALVSLYEQNRRRDPTVLPHDLDSTSTGTPAATIGRQR